MSVISHLSPKDQAFSEEKGIHEEGGRRSCKGISLERGS